MIKWSSTQDAESWEPNGGTAQVPFEVLDQHLENPSRDNGYICLEGDGYCVVIGPLTSPYYSQSSRWFVPENYRDS